MACHTNSISSTSDDVNRPVVDVSDTTPLTNESKAGSNETTLNHMSEVDKQDTDEHSASATHSPMISNMHAQEGNTVPSSSVVNNLANGTVTILVERSKPLILKLRNPQYSLLGFGTPIMPQGDIEQTINEIGEKLIVHITDAVNTIRDEVKRTRPQQEEANYELKMVAYQELLGYITQIMNRLTKVFSQSFDVYRTHVDQLWNDIQRAQNENDVQSYIQQFLDETGRVFQDAVKNDIEPLFEAIEAKLNVLTKMMN